MNALARIDAHLHVWDRSRSSYSWLRTADPALARDFTPAQAHTELSAAGVNGAILVQADDTDSETDYLLEQAADNQWVLGVVGWVPLEAPARAAERLEQLTTSPAFCGVRQLIHNDARTELLGMPTVRSTLALVAASGLPFDVPDAWPGQLSATIELAAAMPELTIVLDHLGKPPRGTDDYPRWRDLVSTLAALPNTVAKVSGLACATAPYSADALRDTWTHALESFGPNRLMYGGDWPMTIMTGGYAKSFAVVNELFHGLSRHERAEIMHGVACRVYGVRDHA